LNVRCFSAPHADTSCASYLFGCTTYDKLGVVDPHAALVDSYLAEAEQIGAAGEDAARRLAGEDASVVVIMAAGAEWPAIQAALDAQAATLAAIVYEPVLQAALRCRNRRESG